MHARRTAALAAVLLASCNGGGGDAPPLTLAPVQAPGTIYAFGGTGSPLQDGAEPKGTLTAVTVNGSTVLFGRTAIGGSNGCDPRHDAMTWNPNDNRIYATTQGVNQTDNATYGNQRRIFSFASTAPSSRFRFRTDH